MQRSERRHAAAHASRALLPCTQEQTHPRRLLAHAAMRARTSSGEDRERQRDVHLSLCMNVRDGRGGALRQQVWASALGWRRARVAAGATALSPRCFRLSSAAERSPHLLSVRSGSPCFVLSVTCAPGQKVHAGPKDRGACAAAASRACRLMCALMRPGHGPPGPLAALSRVGPCLELDGKTRILKRCP
jgi:hypothetical protein